MIVIDASALLDAMLGNRSAGERIAADDVAAPHLIDLEVANAMRHLVRSGRIERPEAIQYVEAMQSADLARYPHHQLLTLIWSLSDNLSAYDAAYVALAQALGVTLVTSDAKLAAAPGLPCEVTLV